MLARALTPEMIAQIEAQAAKVRRLAEEDRPLDLARLRDETAALQALIAEATSLERQVASQRAASRKVA